MPSVRKTLVDGLMSFSECEYFRVTGKWSILWRLSPVRYQPYHHGFETQNLVIESWDEGGEG